MKIKDLNNMYSVLLEDRAPWEADYKRLAEHYYAQKLPIIDRDSDFKQGNLRVDLLDSTGVKSRRVLASGMHGGLTSPARPWFELGLEDTDLMRYKPAKEWLDLTQRYMVDMFRRSNFYNVVYNVYEDVGVFGTNFLFEHYIPGKGLFFKSLPVGSYVLSSDFRNTIDLVFRVEILSPQNLIDEFGKENCSKDVIRKSKKDNKYQKTERIRHAVFLNPDYKPGNKLSKYKKFISYYWEEKVKDSFLRVAGYDEFPGFGSRWYSSGASPYGGSPGQDVLGTLQGLQSMRATQYKQEHKKADPPMITPTGLGYYDGDPGGLTEVNAAEGQKVVYPAEGVRPDTSNLMNIIYDARTEIREGMYNDLFVMLMNMPYNSKMTATEVAQRHEEKLIQLGPVLENLHSDVFTPKIDRTFNLMAANGLLPPVPEELQGQQIKVEFVSILAQAQKMVDTNKVDQFMGFIARNAQLMPDLLDIPDADAIGDGYADYLSVPERMLKPVDQRQAERQARMQAAQARQNAEMGGAAADISKTLSDTKTEGGDNTALDALLQGAVQ